MKLNRTRELWRATCPSGRWYYEIERQACQDLESLFQENFELRDAVESYKIAEASLRNKIAELEAKAEHAEVKGWQNAVSCIQTAVSNWHQDVRDYEGRQAMLQAERELVDELISESPGNWLEEEWKSQQEWMQKVLDTEALWRERVRIQRETIERLQRDVENLAGDVWEPTPAQMAEIGNLDGPLSRGQIHPVDYIRQVLAAK